jgi:phage major head subunit gpT-like protein
MIGTGNFQDALEPIAVKNYQVGFKEIPPERDMMFSVKTSKKLTETYLELGDTGPMNEFTGDLEYEDVNQGYKMTITAREYAKGMKIQKKFILTDQLDIVEGLPKLLGLAARRRIASDVSALLNDAFNTSYTTIDGLQLCSAAHTSNNGGSSQANRGTTAFSETAVDASRISMKAYVSNTDELFEVTPDLLIVPRSLEKAAYELINSSGKVDTANNNANFHKGKYKLLVLDRLDDSNNWFFVDSELMKIFNVWNNVSPLEFGQAEQFDGLAARYRAYMFYGFGSRDWRWIFGSEVS